MSENNSNTEIERSERLNSEENSIHHKESNIFKQLIEILFGGIASFGCFFIAIFCALWLMAGCTHKPTKVFHKPYIIDEASILQTQTKSALQKVKFPKDIPVLIKTLDSIPLGKLAKYTSSCMKNEMYWDSVRHVNFFRSYARFQKPWDNGVYIVISKKPKLIQIRYGNNLRMEAYTRGIAAGPWYVKNQKYKFITLDKHIIVLVNELAQKVEDINKKNWITSTFKKLGSIVWSTIEDSLMMSDNFYSKYLLQYFIKFISFIGGTISIGFFMFITFALFVLYWIFIRGLKEKLLSNNTKYYKAIYMLYISSKVLSFFYSILTIATLILLVRGRTEDLIVLKHYGFGSINPFKIEPSFLVGNGGLFLAIIVSILALLNDILDFASTRTIDMTIFFKFIVWGIIIYSIPKGIGLLITYYLIMRFINGFSILIRKDSLYV